MDTDRGLVGLLESWRQREVELRRPRVDADERPGAARGRPTGEDAPEFLPYGISDERSEPVCEVLATLGPVESEYAALRRGAGLMVCPHRGTLRLTGADRRDFLDRLLTAALADLAAGAVRPAFHLNRKGRIEADLLVIDLDDRTEIDVDVLQAEATVATLGEIIFTEDVTIEDVTAATVRLALHGPAALDVVSAVAGATLDLADRSATEVMIAAAAVVVARRDQTGVPGLELIVPAAAGEAVARALLEDTSDADGRRRVRPVGWYAYNVARVEAGTPLYNVDFGGTNLPHESGVLHDRVSFRKGCYPGQEIVARIESQGRPRQTLVGLRPAGPGLPIAGGQVFAADEGALGTPIGIVTSSAISPMLGSAPMAFAMVRTEAADAAKLVVIAEGEPVEAEVGPLRFWNAPAATEAGP